MQPPQGRGALRGGNCNTCIPDVTCVYTYTCNCIVLSLVMSLPKDSFKQTQSGTRQWHYNIVDGGPTVLQVNRGFLTFT